jgi:hypothetical protein
MPLPDDPPDSGPPSPPTETKNATLAQVAGAVLWSFFGVRKGKAMQRDAVTIKPLQVVVVGVALAALIVFALLALVRLVLHFAQ